LTKDECLGCNPSRDKDGKLDCNWCNVAYHPPESDYWKNHPKKKEPTKTQLMVCEVCGARGNIQSIGNNGYQCGDCKHTFHLE
jgi:hypothetical protein